MNEKTRAELLEMKAEWEAKAKRLKHLMHCNRCLASDLEEIEFAVEDINEMLSIQVRGEASEDQ